MKKTLIALATLAAATGSFAQSTVALTGTFGSAYQSHQTAAVAEVAAKPGSAGTAAAAASNNKGWAPVTDASIKATIVEDLGGGLKATAAGQFAMNASRGGNLTKEDSSVSLAGGFGTVTFMSTRTGDSAIAANVFASWTPITSFYASVSSRASTDAFNYTTPELVPGLKLGFTQAELTEGTGVSAIKNNGLSAVYANGPLMATAAYKISQGVLPAGTNKANLELAGTYDLGVAKLGLGYDQATTKATGKYTDKDMIAYGVSVPVGAVTLGVNGAQRGTNNFYDAGVNYDLSKRTSLRAQFGTIKGTSSSTANNAGNQYRFGVLHTF